MLSFGEKFGLLVARYRESKGWSGEELADKALGDTDKRSRISELETGKVKRPRGATINKLKTTLNIPQAKIDACRDPKKSIASILTLETKEYPNKQEFEERIKVIRENAEKEADNKYKNKITRLEMTIITQSEMISKLSAGSK